MLATRGAPKGAGCRGVGAEFFAQDAKARVGGEAEFDLLAPDTGNNDLYWPLGKQFLDPARYYRCFISSSRFFLRADSTSSPPYAAGFMQYSISSVSNPPPQNCQLPFSYVTWCTDT